MGISTERPRKVKIVLRMKISTTGEGRISTRLRQLADLG
jgi:hypothetical protein